jgi:hypothetical protein
MKEGQDWPLGEYFEEFLGINEPNMEHIEEVAIGVDLAFFEKVLKNVAEEVQELEEDDEDTKPIIFKSDAQRIAWIHKLGIDTFVLEKCKRQHGYNFKRAAEILTTVTNIPVDSLRKTLMALHDPMHDQRNNPLTENKTANKEFVDTLLKRFRLK